MIACVQMKLDLKDYRIEENFEAKIMGLCDHIRRQNSDEQLLIVFPEHVGTFCLLCNAPERVWAQPTFAKASKALLIHHGLKVAHYMLVYRVCAIRALFLARSQELERIYLNTFIKAAKKYQAWIIAGSATLRWGQTDRIFNTSPVITPTGQVIYRQHKVNLVDMEGKDGLNIEPAPLNYMSTVQSPFGRLGVAICLDAFYPEVRERLRTLEAEILLQPSANNGPWDEWQQADWLRSSFQAVAEYKEFSLAINPMLVGSLWDLKFEGQSSIIGQNGYLQRAQSYTEEEILLEKFS